ncbi:unnamed protein product, partial [Ectocarpus sp. 8 AP-2014]
IEATFSPLSSVSHDSTVSFRTSLGQSTCLGFGVDPVIKLSHTVLSLAPACSGDTVTASIFVNNVSAVEQNLEFCVPETEISFLKICPSVIRLFPKEGARIEVSFCPPRVPPYAEALGAAEEKEGTTNEEMKQVEEQQIDTGAQKKGPGGKDAKTKGPNTKSPAAQAATQKAKGSSAPTANNDEELEQKLEEGEDNANGAVAAVADVVNTAHEVPLYAGAVDEGGSTNDGGGHEGGEEEEPWSRHGRWRVPCFLKRTRGHSAGGATGDTGDACLPPLALEVTTVTVERTLSVDQSRVEFGQLAVGTKAEAIVRVRNAGDDDAPLEGGGLNSVGPFEVLNAFRTVPPRGGSHRCVLQFRPERAGIVSETLVLTSPSLGKSIRVCMRGEGVKPVLRMTPADGRLDMGHVLEGDTIEREVKLLNDSVFPLRYATAPFGPRPSSNVNHLEAFSLVPCEGGVPPGESVTVKAIFSPDYSRIWPFLGAFRIEARDQPEGGHLLRIRGRCLSRQVYVEAAPPGQNPGDRTPEATEEALDPRNGLSNRGRGSTEDGRPLPASAGVQSAAPAPSPIVLRFPKSDNSQPATAEEKGGRDHANTKDSSSKATTVMRLIAGCLATNDPKKSSAGSFEMELRAEAREKGFKVTPEKGNISPGSTADISCAFEPPPPPPSLPGPAGGKGGTPEVGQWYKTTALVHLRGGYRPPGSSEVHTVSVQLEG